MKNFICDHCDKKFKSFPVTIGECDTNVWIEHIEDEQNFQCKFCSESHKTYSINYKLLLEINNQKLNDKLDEFDQYDSYRADPFNYVYEYFEDFKRKIDLRKEEIIETVNNHFNQMIDEINQTMKRIKKSIETNDDLIKNFNNVFENIINFKNDVLKESEKINSLKANYKEKNELIKNKLNQIINYKDYLDKSLSILTENKNYHFTDVKKIEEKQFYGEFIYENIEFMKIDDLNQILDKKHELISASWDKTIKIWNLKTGECLRTLKGHTAEIEALIFNNENQIISGSNDKTIKIWDLKTGECLKTLEGHTHWVRSLVINNENELISGSSDNSIKIWNTKAGECLETLNGHTKCIMVLIINRDHKNMLFSF